MLTEFSWLDCSVLVYVVIFIHIAIDHGAYAWLGTFCTRTLFPSEKFDEMSMLSASFSVYLHTYVVDHVN